MQKLVFVLLLLGLQVTVAIAQSSAVANYNYNKLFVIDGHTHDLVKRNGEEPKQAGIDRLKAASIDGIILFFPLNSCPPGTIIQQIRMDKEYIQKIAAGKNIEVKFVNEFNQPKNSSNSYSLQILLGGEIDGLFSSSLERVDQLKAVGISIVVLDDNDLDKITGATYNSKKQFNEFGQKLIRKLNDNDITIDISHLSEELQLEVMQLSTKPVIAGHANAKTIAKVDRNISDKVMDKLFKQGGILLFTFDREDLFGKTPAGNKSGISKLIEHINYIVKNYGIDNIGIGTDYGGSGRNSPADLFDIYCFRKISDGLIKIGYSVEQVRMIMGENIVRFFSEKEG